MKSDPQTAQALHDLLTTRAAYDKASLAHRAAEHVLLRRARELYVAAYEGHHKTRADIPELLPIGQGWTHAAGWVRSLLEKLPRRDDAPKHYQDTRTLLEALANLLDVVSGG
jgi:hypothetical protein